MESWDSNEATAPSQTLAIDDLVNRCKGDVDPNPKNYSSSPKKLQSLYSSPSENDRVMKTIQLCWFNNVSRRLLWSKYFSHVLLFSPLESSIGWTLFRKRKHDMFLQPVWISSLRTVSYCSWDTSKRVMKPYKRIPVLVWCIIGANVCLDSFKESSHPLQFLRLLERYREKCCSQMKIMKRRRRIWSKLLCFSLI